MNRRQQLFALGRARLGPVIAYGDLEHAFQIQGGYDRLAQFVEPAFWPKALGIPHHLNQRAMQTFNKALGRGGRRRNRTGKHAGAPDGGARDQPARHAECC